MSKTYTIWRRSIIDNGSRCECGALVVKDGKPDHVIGQVFINDLGDIFEARICSECHTIAGFRIISDQPEERIINALTGAYDEVVKRGMS